jgi:hypothetical protein
MGQGNQEAHGFMNVAANPMLLTRLLGGIRVHVRAVILCCMCLPYDPGSLAVCTASLLQMLHCYSVVQDFAEAGHKWTVDLCQKDSDKDGFTNGQELGDPDCKVTGEWLG